MGIMTIVLFVVGLVLLIVGAEALVRGASRAAVGLGISPLVVGLTVVAFGTSSPELAVSVQAAFTPEGSAIALGNVVGSNIANILLILGLSAAVTPLVVSQQLIRLDVPLMIGVSLVLLLFSLDGTIGRVEGALLFAGLIGYITFAIVQSRKENRQIQAEYEQEYQPGTPHSPAGWLLNIGLIVVGLAMLVVGSDWLVEGAVTVAALLGVSDLVIGLTVVAVGTSLPEIATSVVAALRGERDIAVGNAIGSNLFNIMSVLGLASLVAPQGIVVPASALHFDIPVMLAVAVACLPIFFTERCIARWEGILFLAYYGVYIAYLVLSATNSAILRVFHTSLILFVLPITVVTLVVLVVRALRAERRLTRERGASLGNEA